jgi:hypothetical protein
MIVVLTVPNSDCRRRGEVEGGIDALLSLCAHLFLSCDTNHMTFEGERKWDHEPPGLNL